MVGKPIDQIKYPRIRVYCGVFHVSEIEAKNVMIYLDHWDTRK